MSKHSSITSTTFLMTDLFICFKVPSKHDNNKDKNKNRCTSKEENKITTLYFNDSSFYISFILAIKSSIDNSSSRVVLAADVSLSEVSI